MNAEPPHWKDAPGRRGPAAWLTVRSWRCEIVKLANGTDTELHRAPLVWLRQTESGAAQHHGQRALRRATPPTASPAANGETGRARRRETCCARTTLSEDFRLHGRSGGLRRRGEVRPRSPARQPLARSA